MVDYLTCEQVVELHAELIRLYGGSVGILHPGALASCVDSPLTSAFGEEVYKTIPQKAAAYGYFLVKNHCFIDGNHRIAFGCMDTFLAMNGFYLNVTFGQAMEALKMVSGNLMDKDGFIFWVQNNVASVDA